MDAINAAVMIAFQFAMLAALVWFVGSIALRLFGWLWVFFGLAIAFSGAASGDATPGTYALAAFNIVLGVVLWAAGHTIHRVRHGYWKSSVMHRAVGATLRHE